MTRRLAIAVAVASLGAACSGDPEPPAPEPIFPDGFEQSYVEVRSCRFSIEHDGASIRVFASPGAAAAYEDGTYPFEAGTVLVKQQHADTSCTDLTGYTAMRKEPDGSWSWQSVSSARVVDEAADPERCARCHAGCTNGRDSACTDP